MTVVHESDLVTLIHGDALRLSDYIEPESIDLCVTSPPYFALRSYQDDGSHYSGQIGSEATPQDFLEALWAVTAECVKVLRSTGSIWVNLGDKYANAAPSGSAGYSNVGSWKRDTSDLIPPINTAGFGIKSKSLMGLPWRYAIGCIDRLGLILRAEVVWSKPNGLPESVTDRVRRSHETWFHFTRQGRYFAAVDEVREAHIGGGKGLTVEERRSDPEMALAMHRNLPARNGGGGKFVTFAGNPLGKLPGSVWSIPSEPLTVPAELGIDHFAAFPTEWPRRIIAGWSPTGYCTACDEPRRAVVEPSEEYAKRRGPGTDWNRGGNRGNGDRRSAVHHLDSDHRFLGYACACPTPDAPTRPATVLDPFCGTGTVPLVASVLDRHGIGLDLSRDYLKIAEWRVNDPAQRAKVARKQTGVAPTIVHPDQLSMFGEGEG